MGVEWTRHALRLDQMGLDDFFRSFGLEASRVAQGYPELSLQHVLERTHDLHQRHAKAVLKVLEKAIMDNSALLAWGRLPPSSLLVMHLGSQANAPNARLPSIAVRTAFPLERPRDAPLEDMRPDPSAPLQVAFFMEGDRHVVAVTGMARIEGAPAIVPHALKPIFDEDRSKGRAPEEHRFVNLLVPPVALALSKDQVRKLAQRCRETLALSYEQLFGHRPDAPLLLQSKQRHGYRLDPTIRLTNRPD